MGKTKGPSSRSRATAAWMRWLDDNKAADLKLVDLRGRSDITDYFILGTAGSRRHLEHLRDEAMAMAKRKGEGLIHADGLDSSGWAALDFGDYMIHLFLPELRALYDLDGLWAPAEKMEGPEKRNKKKAGGALTGAGILPVEAEDGRVPWP